MSSIAEFNQILNAFKIKANCLDAKQIDNYTFYDLKLINNTKISQIQKYGDEISLALKTPCRPSIKILHELGLIRLEFITPNNKALKLLDFFDGNNLPKGDLMTCLGQTVDGKKVWMDLAQNPHMIVSGTTGSGKSTLLHNIIGNLLIDNNECIIYLSDPKNIEFHEYEKLINKDVNVRYTYDETIFILDGLLATMEERYHLIRQGKPPNIFPYILLIVDEFADLIMQDIDNQFCNKLCKLAQKCRASRISIILSTQRPSVNIISGAIKANFPARISCKVATHVDSKVILDTSGAENLLGKGDALLRDNVRYLERFQVAYTDANEIVNYVNKSGNNV